MSLALADLGGRHTWNNTALVHEVFVGQKSKSRNMNTVEPSWDEKQPPDDPECHQILTPIRRVRNLGREDR